jgi:hypothetical protein
MRRADFLIALAMMPILLAGCQGGNQSTTPSSAETGGAPSRATSMAGATSRPTDAWLGQWIGPEGTYLLLSRDGEKYIVKIQALDGPATYQGLAAGNQIQFERQGKSEFIRAGRGEETGMKWLLDKKNCLIIKTGEGFCRG